MADVTVALAGMTTLWANWPLRGGICGLSMAPAMLVFPVEAESIPESVDVFLLATNYSTGTLYISSYQGDSCGNGAMASCSQLGHGKGMLC